MHWEAPEFESREKSIGWYWTTIIVAVLMLAGAVWQRNFLFAVLVVIGEILVLIWSGKEPRTVAFRITDHELLIDEKTRYALNELHSFSVEPEGHSHWPVIALVSKRRFRPAVHIRAPKDRIEGIRERLQISVPESAWEESLIEMLEKFFRF
jgi:hypothetical protein